VEYRPTGYGDEVWTWNINLLIVQYMLHFRRNVRRQCLCYAESSVSVMIIMPKGGAQQGDPLARISAILLGNTTNCRQTVV